VREKMIQELASTVIIAQNQTQQEEGHMGKNPTRTNRFHNMLAENLEQTELSTIQKVRGRTLKNILANFYYN
jgi:hypothetical protein